MIESEAKNCPRCDAKLEYGQSAANCPVCMLRQVVDLTSSVHLDPLFDEASEPESKNDERVNRIGDYELLDEIGRGGMGAVYRARHLSLQREVALKVVLAGEFASELELERFRHEATAASQLDHPNIVSIYEVGEADGRAYHTMQWIPGKSLAEKIDEWALDRPSGASAGRTSVFNKQTQIAHLIEQVARAIHFAHQRGILHRDLKPANILLNDKQAPFVTDFGLAKQLKTDSDLTVSGTVMGSPHYMSPEQASGKGRQVTVATDIYSLGAILFHLLAGRPPLRR